MTEKFFTIGKLSSKTGCKPETIRYYEQVGLLFEPTRSESGYRLYDYDGLKRLNFILHSRELGFSQNSIRELLHLVDKGEYTCEQVEAMVQGQLKEIRLKISQLKVLESALSDMAQKCEKGKTPDCPIVDLLFKVD